MGSGRLRCFLARTTKFPKPEILIFSPSASTSFIVSNTASTTSAASFFEKPPTLLVHGIDDFGFRHSVVVLQRPGMAEKTINRLNLKGWHARTH